MTVRVEDGVEESVDLKDSSEVISVRDAMAAVGKSQVTIVAQRDCDFFVGKGMSAQGCGRLVSSEVLITNPSSTNLVAVIVVRDRNDATLTSRGSAPSGHL